MPVQHIALFGFKAGTTGAFIQRTAEELGRLTRVIPGITGFSIGANSSPEGLDGGFTHGFVMTLKDASARDAYLSHPEHEKFKALVLPYIERIVVFDYEG